MEHQQGNEGQGDVGARRDAIGTSASSSAAIIEDEPASDFYASLVGVKPSSVSRKRKRILPSSPTSASAESNRDRRNMRSRSRIHPTSASHIVDALKGEEESHDQSTHGQEGVAASQSEMARTLHRAFANPPTNQTSLSLDKSNKGYAMLNGMGWSEDSGGLGKSRQGEMLPVKTTLKMDKRGLGSGTGRRGKPSARGSAEAKITHKHDDIEAAAGRNRGKTTGTGPSDETKAQRKKRKKREAQKAAHDDRRVRMMLQSDIPPEYEDLYMQLHK